MITHSIGDVVTRLGIDLNKIREYSFGWSGSGGESANFSRGWFEGRVFNRLSGFHLKEQQVVTLERFHIAGRHPELIYKIRVLTPIAEVEKELTVPI